MTEAALLGPRWAPALWVARRAAGILTGGALAALLWLIIWNQGIRRGWTDHDVALGLGELVGGNASRTGLYATIVAGVGLALVYAALEPWLPDRRWWAKGLTFATVPFLLWGLGFCPFVDSIRQRQLDGSIALLPSDPFAADAGGGTIPIAIVASVAAATLIARCYSLMREPAWWRPRERHLEEALEAISERGSGSLELPEEGPKEPRVGT
jgi:hypothetical protein